MAQKWCVALLALGSTGLTIVEVLVSLVLDVFLVFLIFFLYDVVNPDQFSQIQQADISHRRNQVPRSPNVEDKWFGIWHQAALAQRWSYAPLQQHISWPRTHNFELCKKWKMGPRKTSS
jgi:hypothetical protein